MKKFPLPLHRKNGHLIELDDAQLEWLKRYFPVIENKRVAKAMGISGDTLKRLCKDYGISKSEEGLAAIRRRQHARAAKTNHRNGCYDRKRGHAPSEATLEGVRKYWDDVRSGHRDSGISRVRREEPDKYAEWMENKRAERKELVRKEILRMKYGLGRKTNLKQVVMCPFKQSQRHHRYNALKRGYLLDVDCSEGTSGRYTIYWDDQTQRSEAFERNCIADGFKFVRDDG